MSWELIGMPGQDFYPRPPRGGRQQRNGWRSPIQYFYPRPPRGGRPIHSPRSLSTKQFLSTPSARRATLQDAQGPLKGGISIHALREEGDPPLDSKISESMYFYPRPPRGGRPATYPGATDPKLISIHALREEGDYGCALPEDLEKISIHALREEGDALPSSKQLKFLHFYPRPPRGGRQQKQRQNLYFQTNYTTFCTNLEEP